MIDLALLMTRQPDLKKSIEENKGHECIVQVSDNINTMTTYIAKDWNEQILLTATITASKVLMEQSENKNSFMDLRIQSVEKFLKKAEQQNPKDRAKIQEIVADFKESYKRKKKNNDTSLEITKL